jgi:sugar O-acyltransferase (sialic acid O-acetyltransferase NeuD family)
MESKPQIILIGGGGHCKSVIDIIEAGNFYQIAGIVDLPKNLGKKILGFNTIATDNNIPEMVRKYPFFFITIGHIDFPVLRNKLFNLVKKNNGKLPVIVSPSAHISPYANIEEGTVVMHQAIINADSHVGKNCIINNKALIEHDCIISDFCHISTNTVINGNCLIGKNSFIGSMAVIRQGIEISENVIIGAGSVVVKRINTPGVYVGNPAKKIK